MKAVLRSPLVVGFAVIVCLAAFSWPVYYSGFRRYRHAVAALLTLGMDPQNESMCKSYAYLVQLRTAAEYGGAGTSIDHGTEEGDGEDFLDGIKQQEGDDPQREPLGGVKQSELPITGGGAGINIGHGTEEDDGEDFHDGIKKQEGDEPQRKPLGNGGQGEVGAMSRPYEEDDDESFREPVNEHFKTVVDDKTRRHLLLDLSTLILNLKDSKQKEFYAALSSIKFGRRDVGTGHVCTAMYEGETWDLGVVLGSYEEKSIEADATEDYCRWRRWIFCLDYPDYWKVQFEAKGDVKLTKIYHNSVKLPHITASISVKLVGEKLPKEEHQFYDVHPGDKRSGHSAFFKLSEPLGTLNDTSSLESFKLRFLNPNANSDVRPIPVKSKSTNDIFVYLLGLTFPETDYCQELWLPIIQKDTEILVSNGETVTVQGKLGKLTVEDNTLTFTVNKV